MNATQKKRMFSHYEALGWTQGEILAYGTVDLKGTAPVQSWHRGVKATSTKKTTKVSKKEDTK